eukprot:3321263-Prymnesium_polylepis.1
MPAAISEPLSSSAQPYEARRARGRARRAPWRFRFGPRGYLCVKRLNTHLWAGAFAAGPLCVPPLSPPQSTPCRAGWR